MSSDIGGGGIGTEDSHRLGFGEDGAAEAELVGNGPVRFPGDEPRGIGFVGACGRRLQTQDNRRPVLATPALQYCRWQERIQTRANQALPDLKEFRARHGSACLLLMITAVLMAPPLGSASGVQEAAKVATKEPAAARQPTEVVPDGVALSILIRRTLLTLNDANLSGNYTVLRDLAAPGFQAANDPAKLAGIFVKLRSSKIDLGPIFYFEPKLARQPEIASNGLLRLSGFMPTRPQQVNFDMLFQNMSGRWRAEEARSVASKWRRNRAGVKIVDCGAKIRRTASK